MTHLTKVLESVNGNSIISIDTSTDVKLKGGKKNPLQGMVRKVTTGSNVMIFQNKKTNGYKAMVERRLKSEGKDPSSFKLAPRTWGTRMPETPFIEHKGQHYLEVIFLHPGKSHYEVNGQQVKAAHIDGLPETPPQGKQGGLENKVIIRPYKVDSITQITVNKETYTDISF